MLNASQIVLSRSGKQILREINLEVKSGEQLAIVGPNGAGKSSLLKCLAGLLSPSAGEVSIDGQSLRKCSRLELAQKIAYLPQTFEVWLPLSVFEFVLMARYSQRSSRFAFGAKDFAACERALKLCRVWDLREKELRVISGGERQLTLIAGALAQQAKIFLLDEPTTFLDPINQQFVHAVLKELLQELDLTLIAATHDLNSALIAYGRIVGLREGRVVFDGAAKEFVKSQNLIAVYGKDFPKVKHPQIDMELILPDGLNLSTNI